MNTSIFAEAETFYDLAPADWGDWLEGLSLAQTIGGSDAPAPLSPVVHPASGQVVTHYADAVVGHVDEAVEAARAAFPDWSRRPVEERRAMLMTLADRVWDERATFTMLLSVETGRPLRKAFGELLYSVDYIRLIASQQVDDHVYQREGVRARLVHRPIGVAGAIAPWNAPLVLGVAKICNALMAGDTQVFRPAPQTPLSAMHLGRIAREILPPGVFNVITGNAEVGAAMCAHPGIGKISFTGSTTTGRLIAAAAAPTLKKLSLELGGNDAAIVLPDADLDAVAQTVWGISLENAGQFCAAIKRLYVHESVYADVRDRLLALADTWQAGAVDDKSSTLSPLQSEQQRARVQSYVDGSRALGRTVHQRALPDGQPGFFLAPTLVEGCEESDPLVAEEQFGPVLPIMPFTDENAALAAANDSEFGLGGSVWSADVERAVTLAEQFEVGTAWVNQHGAYTAALPLPFAKQSGIGIDFADCGVREHSRPMLVNVKA